MLKRVYFHYMVRIDQRYYQIAVLTVLLLYGKYIIRIPHLSDGYVLTIVATAQLAQLAMSRIHAIRFDPRSPLISSLSISILLNSQVLWIGALAATIMVLSKFMVRVKGSHVFNPANVAIITTIFLFPARAAITPGQWGDTAILVIIALAALGVFVTGSVRRYDVALMFVCGFVGAWAGASYLNYRSIYQIPHMTLTIPFVLFMFYMITDPLTIPTNAIMRWYYGLFVGMLGVYLHIVHGLVPGFIYALFFLSPIVPIMNGVMRGDKMFRWASR